MKTWMCALMLEMCIRDRADPETASMNSAQSRGFDNGTYPTSKKMVFGINVTF